MQPYLIEGIVVSTTFFQERDLIIHLFTEEGLLSLFAKGGAFKSRTSLQPHPLMRIECQITPGRSGMPKCREIGLINGFLSLRENLNLLCCASEILKGIKTSQIHQKPAKELYRLTLTYLEHLPLADPETLLASFYLKLLRHEGLFFIQSGCSFCKTDLSSFYLSHGERFCSQHAPQRAFEFSEEEGLLITTLTLSRSMKELQSLPSSPLLLKKIKALFKEQCIHS